MFIKTQTFMVLGVSKSGYAVAKNILSNGGKCYLYEELKSPKIDASLKELIECGAQRVEIEEVEERLLLIDVLVLSPGVPINHEVAIKAKKLGKRIIGELEYGVIQFIPPIIAITGTNGKTTTVSLLNAILNQSGQNCCLVGNVGVPLTSKISDIGKDSLCVAEVSSFQLESINSFCPHISCVLNVSPDHLERHYSMDNYIFLKKRIFKNQKESEYCVLNFDDKIVRGFYTEIKAKVIWVSLTERVDGAYRLEGKLYFRDEFIMNESDLKLKGEHNVYNALFAIACSKLLGIENIHITFALENFKGVRHRIELIAEKEGVTFYNDSKATNTASTMSAIDTMSNPTILILGGSEKGENYDSLFEKIKSSFVKHVVLTGASRYNMLESAGRIGYSEITVTADFYHAIKIAKLISEKGDCVLLSPACASYDRFSGYEERGDAFSKTVEQI